MAFKPNRRFKKEYDQLFRMDPITANLFLLMCELADEKGQVQVIEEELAVLMNVRFNDPKEYAL